MSDTNKPSEVAAPADTPVVAPEPVTATAPAPPIESAAKTEALVTATTTADPATAATTAATTTTTAPTTEETTADAKPETAPAQETTEPAEEKEASPLAQLWEAAKDHAHPEIWGVPLADPANHIPSQIVFQKYLNANDGDLVKAKDQLIKTLDWRKKTDPLEVVRRMYSKSKFEGLGFVTTYAVDGKEVDEPEEREIFTWNIYGGVKSIDETFGNLEEFINWRVALMELALQELNICGAIKPITAEYDPYKLFQVHDYKSISFLRSPPHVKSASSETIKVFAQNYPELLKEKFFVNVPAIMGFVYGFMKLFVAPKTIKKFHPMSNGANLAKEFADSRIAGLGEKLPAEYGGKGGELKTVGKESFLTAE
ncbi:CRAL-TRIO domain-containing protein [Triangularia verruculosa]|uniref:Phosphatidylinositol transfer protein SFH5 n=1 Tax=Triangularia verruculosa TaxID=2587418 RepID=A0AAN6XFY7_9PEZI|nr:CRAL-TRIO domain-containing protein [Triangularia verruculosa]